VGWRRAKSQELLLHLLVAFDDEYAQKSQSAFISRYSYPRDTEIIAERCGSNTSTLPQILRILIASMKNKIKIKIELR